MDYRHYGNCLLCDDKTDLSNDLACQECTEDVKAIDKEQARILMRELERRETSTEVFL